MKSLSLVLFLLAASGARADWLNYTVAVSNSPSGSFGPTANLWTQGPLTVDLAAETGTPDIFGGNAYVPIGLLTANFGSSEAPPANFPQMPFAFQIAGKKPFILSGQLNVLSNGVISFANVTASDQSVSVSLEAMGRGGAAEAPPMPPGWTPFLVVESDIYAVVPLDDLAQTPEPSALILAGMAALALFEARRRKKL